LLNFDALILPSKKRWGEEVLGRGNMERLETVDLLRDERQHDEDARLAAAAYSSLFFGALRHLRASLVELQTHSVMEKQTEAHTME
jgi:hypothetical protein